MKAISLSKYFEIIKPKYVYLKLIPHSSIRNYNSSNIAKAIHYMQKSISQRIKKEEKKLMFETQVKCSYLIDIYKDKVDFYFIVPQQYMSIVKEKIKETWNKVTIEELNFISPFSNNYVTYEISYKKEDALSLNVDKKSNEPLNHILNVIDIMQNDDRISIYYNFIPIKQFGWTGEYDNTIKKIKTRQPIEKQKTSTRYIGKLLLTNIIELLDGFLEVINDVMGGNNKSNNNDLSLLDLAITTLNTNKDLSEYTKKKRNNIILNTQTLVLSESKDKIRINNNAISVCQSYKAIDGDNELIYKKVKTKDINITDFKLPISINKMTIDECKNLIQLPGKELLEEYKIINHVNTLEMSVPKELCQGTMCIGEVKTNNNIQKAYLSSDKEFKNLTLCLIAPTRAGKTTLISNIARDSINTNETTILFDFLW